MLGGGPAAGLHFDVGGEARDDVGRGIAVLIQIPKPMLLKEQVRRVLVIALRLVVVIAVLVGLIPDGLDGEPNAVYACQDCQRARGLEPYAAGGPMGVVRMVSGELLPL